MLLFSGVVGLSFALASGGAAPAPRRGASVGGGGPEMNEECRDRRRAPPAAASALLVGGGGAGFRTGWLPSVATWPATWSARAPSCSALLPLPNCASNAS